MNDTKKYVSSPVASDYKSKNAEAIQTALGMSKSNRRFLSSKDKVSRTSAPNGFRFFETELISTKNVKFTESSPSMLDPNFIDYCKGASGRVYNVIRFDRKHNIKQLDFTLTYNQIANWGAGKFTTAPVTRTFIGSIIFTGCSTIKDTKTYDDIPFEAHVRYESIGDGIGDENSIDGFGDSKGGPSVTFSYGITDDYVYIFASDITPFRMIPKEDGTFVDISYAEGRGTFIGEVRENVTAKNNKLTGSTKLVPFSANKDIHFDLFVSFKDISISSSDSELEAIDILSDDFKRDYEIMKPTINSFTIRPTKGEVVTYGMTPASDVDLEIATDIAPVKYNSRLLKTDMTKVNSFIEKLEDLIKKSSTSVDKVSFVIKSILRKKGKYNIRGNYFLDSDVDSFGQVVVTEVGTYDAITDKFEITCRVFDKDRVRNNETVEGFRKLSGENASDYLKEITKDNPFINYTKNTDKVLSLFRDIDFKEPDNLNVYSEISFIRNSDNVNCFKSFIELKDDTGVRDNVVYFNNNRSVTVCDFKDYDMANAETSYPFEKIVEKDYNSGVLPVFKITDVVRTFDQELKEYKYIVCTNLGLVFIGNLKFVDSKYSLVGDFISPFRDSDYVIDESVTCVYQDDSTIVLSGSKGNLSFFDKNTFEFTKFDTKLDPNEKVMAVSKTADDTGRYIIFATTKRVVTYDFKNKSWIISVKDEKYDVETKYNKVNSGMDENVDMLPCLEGFENVPSTQVGRYRYYLGLRKDPSGYSGVYKRVDLKTGEVKDVSTPAVELFKSTLASDERYIYCIGGDTRETVDKTISSPENINDVILKYDTYKDEWQSAETDFVLKDTEIEEGDSTNRKFISGCPIVVDNKIYIFRPKVLYFTRSSLTNDLIKNEVHDKNLYIISFDETENKYTVISKAISFKGIDDLLNINSSMYLFDKLDNKIRLFFGTRNIDEIVNEADQSITREFKSYDIHFIEYNIDTDEYSLIGSIPVDDEYLLSKYSTYWGESKEDLFEESARCKTKDYMIAFVLDFFLYFDFNNKVVFLPLYANNANLDNVQVAKRLLEENEYESEWKTSSRVPTNVNLSVLNDTKILMIGGNSLRIPIVMDVTDIDHPAIFETPTTIPRVSSDTISSTLNVTNYGDYIRVIPTFGLECESIGLAERKNVVVAMMNQKGYEDPSVYLMDKTVDKHFIWMRDATVAGNTKENYYSDYKGVMIGHYAIFCPEVLNSSNIKISSGSYSDAKIIIYNLLDKNNFGTIEFGEEMTKRCFIYSAIYEQAILLYETASGETKALKIVYDLATDSLITDKISVNGSLNIPTLNAEWERRQEAILTGGSFGTKSFVVSSNGIVVFDFFKLINGVLSYKEFSNVFANETCNRSVTQDDNFIYIGGGDSEQDTGLYRIAISDLATNDKYLVKDRAQLSVPVSANKYPIYNTVESIFVYGKKSADNSLSMSIVSEQKKSELDFDNDRTVIPLNKISSSQFNRHYPDLHTVNFDGHEFLIVMSGRQGETTDLTKYVDAFDVDRRRWILLPELPVVLKNATFIGNSIIGATKINDNSEESAYVHKIDLICKNYDDHSFEWKDTTISESYPNPKFTSSIHGDSVLVVGTTDDGMLINTDNSIKLFTKTDDNYTYTNIPTIYLNSQLKYKIVYCELFDDNVIRLGLFVDNNIVVWKYDSVNGWMLEITKNEVNKDLSGGKILHIDNSSTEPSVFKSVYLYRTENTIEAMSIDGENITSTILFDVRNCCRKDSMSLTNYYSFTISLVSGWIFLFDTKTNSYFAVTPNMYGSNTYLSKVDASDVQDNNVASDLDGSLYCAILLKEHIDTKYYAAKETESDTKLRFIEKKSDVVVKDRRYDIGSQFKLIKGNDESFILVNNGKSNSIIYRCFVDVNDKINPLYYRDILCSVNSNVFKLQDNLIYKDSIKSIVNLNNGVAVKTDGVVAKQFMLNDNSIGKLYYINDKIYHLSIVNTGEKFVRLAVYDNKQNVIYDNLLFKDTLDEYVEEIDVDSIPLNSDLAFAYGNSLYVYSNADKTLYIINIINGGIYRKKFEELTNVNSINHFDNDIDEVFVLDDNKSIYTLDLTTLVLTKKYESEISIESIDSLCKYNLFITEKLNDITVESIIDEGTVRARYPKDMRLHKPGFKTVISKYDRCEEYKSDRNGVSYKLDGFSVSVVNGTNLVVYVDKDGFETTITSDENVAWVTELKNIIFVGYKTNDVLTKIKAFKYSGNYSFDVRELVPGGNLVKCIGSAVGISSDRKESEGATYYDGHIVCINNNNTNKIYDIIPEYPAEYSDIYEAFDVFTFKENEIHVFDDLSDTEIFNLKPLKSRNDSLILIGDSSITSRSITFNDYLNPTIKDFNFTRTGNIIFVYEVMDTIYVGTIVNEVNKTYVNVYELFISTNGSLQRSRLLGAMILPKILVDIRNVIVHSENDRMPDIESIETCCPIIFFLDTNIPISEYNQRFIGSNYAKSANKVPLSQMTPLKVEFENGIPILYMYSRAWDKAIINIDGNIHSEKVNDVRLLKIGLKDRWFTNKYSEYWSSVSDGIKKVYGSKNENHEMISMLPEYYNTLISESEVDDYIVKIYDSKYIEIKNLDNSISSFTDTSYPFNEELITTVSSYNDDRFIIFTDIYGNISTYDRNLKKFVDVNGEISVDVPYFSTEIKIYPSKIISGGNVAKRVWAFSTTNPYTIGAHDPDNISKTDLTLFE